MNDDKQNINIQIGQGPYNHAWTVLGTLLLCGSAGAIAWLLGNAGMLDLAATGMTFFFTQLINMMFKVGLIVIPENKKDVSFKETSGLLRTAWREFQEYQARSPIWRLAALALGFTIVFMSARYAISIALSVFNNVVAAGAAAGLLASLIVAPNLFSDGLKRMRSTGVQVRTSTDGRTAVEPPEQERPAPAVTPAAQTGEVETESWR